MDFETRTFDSGLTKTRKDGTIVAINSTEVISAVIYDGVEYKTYFMNDYQSWSIRLTL